MLLGLCKFPCLDLSNKILFKVSNFEITLFSKIYLLFSSKLLLILLVAIKSSISLGNIFGSSNILELVSDFLNKLPLIFIVALLGSIVLQILTAFI